MTGGGMTRDAAGLRAPGLTRGLARRRTPRLWDAPPAGQSQPRSR